MPHPIYFQLESTVLIAKKNVSPSNTKHSLHYRKIKLKKNKVTDKNSKLYL